MYTMLNYNLAFSFVLALVLLSNGPFLAFSQDTSDVTIPSAGAVKLQNLIGDIENEGPCSVDITVFCAVIKAGEGRLVDCISKRIDAEIKGNVVGRTVSDKCLENLASFKAERSKNINLDIPLAKACKADVAKFCASKSDKESPTVLPCLRSVKPQLSSACKAEVFRTQREALADFRTDIALYKSCKSDVSKLCPQAEPGDGIEITCLQEHRPYTSDVCRNELFRFEREAGDDIRLSPRLFTKCQLAQSKFCKDVQPGDMRVQECLEDNMDKPGFPPACSAALEDVLSQRVADFRLDTALREACQAELPVMCGLTLEEMDSSDTLRRSGIKCLQEYKESLKGAKCRDEVHRQMSRAARDFRFDEVLANVCTNDRNKYCSDVQAGSARVIRCLQDNRAGLDKSCAAALFDHEVRMAEDIDFNYPMKKACAWEIGSFCKKVEHGHARVIRCLEGFLEHAEMSRECKDEVVRHTNHMAQDYRLNFRLNQACKDEVGRLCPNSCSTQPGSAACGGLVLQCLQDSQDNITSDACREEILYFELMEVSDFRNDIILAEACREDVETYCSGVEPGEGRVHTCLRYHKDEISERCRNEEMKLAAIEYRDIRLRPKLNQQCSEEKAIYCKDVKPGNARVIKCLMDSMAKPNFGEECREELQKREAVMKTDYRFDVGVSTNCAPDIEEFCKDEKSKLRGTAAVLKCLVERFGNLEEKCQAEMSRAVRMALWDFTPGSALTMVCDEDVTSLCPRGMKSKSGSIFTIGVVGRCLSKALVENKALEPACRHLVLTAAPREARAYYEGSDAMTALVQKLATLQKAAGLGEAGLVDARAHARGEGAVTVTGWVALACVVSLAVVLVGGAFLLYRRFAGLDKPETVHVKMGDA